MFDISVIIPAYNAEKWIGRAITSVLNQTVKPIEIIVVNDGSTDGTAEVVQKYGSAVRYFHQDNSGVAAARNVGIMNARCEWIAFLDADDEWLPNWVPKHQEVMNSHSDCQWSACNFEYSKEEARVSPVARDPSATETVVDYFDAQVNGFRFQTSGFLVHRRILDTVGIFNPTLARGEDVDLWSRIAMRFPKIGYSSEICYRCGSDNAGSLTRTKHVRDPQLKNICDNLRVAHALGEESVRAYYPYARKRAASYILRAAAQQVCLEHETVDEAKAKFPLSFRERALETVLKMLPKALSAKIAGRCVD